MATQVKRRRFTVDEYYKMGEVGLLSEDDRVELIDGEILEMAPIGSRHSGCVKQLAALFHHALGERVVVSVQDPIRLGVHSEPQPDIALLRARPDFYRSAHPGPDDVLLVIEVADSSIAYDREVKVPLYAASGIPEVWVVDLEGRTIETYRSPRSAGYLTHHAAGTGERLSPGAFPDLVVAVDEILGS